jgi:hypothetical protein
VTPGISPFSDNFLKHRRHNSNVWYTALGLPQIRHLDLCLTLYLLGFLAFATVDVFATLSSFYAKGIPRCFNNALLS